MGISDEISLTIHGLVVDNGNVRADVFHQKFQAILKTLVAADQSVNEKKSHDYLIVGLKTESGSRGGNSSQNLASDR
jgi:hypothetical protein